MIKEGDRVCVGLSGGADSVCLLWVLCQLKEKLNTEVLAFHVNHCLRGEESDSDEDYVRGLCQRLKIDLKSFRYDISGLARENKKSLEEMGRIMRRKAARELIENGAATKIALAHHINDKAETVLFNMARGSSLEGLKGIAAVKDHVIRPLLCLTRDEIERLLTDEGISWRIDSSNLKTDYSRNRIRLEVLPYLEKHINSQSIRHISDAASDIEEANEILKEMARERSKVLLNQKKEKIYISPEILKERRLIAGYIIMEAVEHLTGTLADITRGHGNMVLELLTKQNGRSVNLPYGLLAEKVYEGVRLSKRKTETLKEQPVEELIINGITRFAGLKIKTRVIEENFELKDIPKKNYTKWFDYDKISTKSVLRFRRAGDMITVDSKGHKKKLKEYFIDEKIPAEKRDRTVILAIDSHIVWIIGCRIGENYKVSEDTKKILEIEIQEEPGNEGKDQCSYR